jgi:hypothetical protein
MMRNMQGRQRIASACATIDKSSVSDEKRGVIAIPSGVVVKVVSKR